MAPQSSTSELRHSVPFERELRPTSGPCRSWSCRHFPVTGPEVEVGGLSLGGPDLVDVGEVLSLKIRPPQTREMDSGCRTNQSSRQEVGLSVYLFRRLLTYLLPSHSRSQPQDFLTPSPVTHPGLRDGGCIPPSVPCTGVRDVQWMG